MTFDICYGFTNGQWAALRQMLDAEGSEVAWNQAITVFQRRMEERFFSSIDALVQADTKPDLEAKSVETHATCIPGFSIIAICCLFIETLQGFREPSPVFIGPKQKCTFPDGRCCKPPDGTGERFRAFLRRPAFGDAFIDDAIATAFVNGIRNGILHEAETRKWVIWRSEPIAGILAVEGDGFALNRTLFCAAVRAEFESYLQQLHDPANEELRRRFKRKMDDIGKDRR
jgi:hypothetical protein